VQINGESGARHFDGFATRVFIDVTACPAFPRAKVSIKGLSLDTMAAMTRLGYEAFTQALNKIQVLAAEGNAAPSLIFEGEIITAWANFNSAPNVEFQIDALSGSFPALQPQPPIAIQGEQQAATVIESLCKQIGYDFENNGVTTAISDLHLEGDPIAKIRQIGEKYGFNVIIDNRTIAIVPNGKVRDTGAIARVSAENGLIGYPTFNEKGISFECLYRPEIRIGGYVELDTIVPRAKGQWIVVGVKHELSANDPESAVWKTQVTGVFPTYGVAS
jgi:hypothetical protein